MRIIHLLLDEKFTSEYVKMVDSELNKDKKHEFYIITKHKELRYPLYDNHPIIIINDSLKGFLHLSYLLKSADRIIVHGLFNTYLVYLIYLLRVSNKITWAIWGGDLYDYETEGRFFFRIKKSIISGFNSVTTIIDGDVEIARKVYGFKGEYYPCLLYFSNVIDEKMDRTVIEKKEGEYNIIIGNSADQENRHEYILSIMKKIDMLDKLNPKVIVPLSYGSVENAKRVKQLYTSEFGSHVICLQEFMKKKDYLGMLSSVDVALFAHRRQQAVGNIIQLVDMGAKIYMEPYVTTFTWLIKKGIKVFNIEELNSDLWCPLSEEEKSSNSKIIRRIANKDELIKQWKAIFDNI